jgi:hypothetical protein
MAALSTISCRPRFKPSEASLEALEASLEALTACVSLQLAPESLAQFQAELLQLGFRRGIGLLEIDAPIAQILKGYLGARDRAAHVSTWTDDSDFTVEIFDLGFSGRQGTTFKSVHWFR